MTSENLRAPGRWGRTNRDTDPRHNIRDEGFDRRGGWRRGSDYYGDYGSWPGRSGIGEPLGSRAEIAGDGDRSRSHRGRGPQGYKRSDERIHEDVCDCLSDDSDIDASAVEVRVDDGVVTISGSVRSRGEKRRAEDVIADLRGVKDVRNELRVAQAVTS